MCCKNLQCMCDIFYALNWFSWSELWPIDQEIHCLNAGFLLHAVDVTLWPYKPHWMCMAKSYISHTILWWTIYHSKMTYVLLQPGGMHAGTFDPYPSHPADPYKMKSTGRTLVVNKTGKIFMPNAGPKSAPITSVLDQNVVKWVFSIWKS